MTHIFDLEEKYKDLDWHITPESEESITQDVLLTFKYEYAGQSAEVTIDTEEFTALCPWTGLPDLGKLIVKYTPYQKCIELKSLKYYLLSYRNVGIVQEHAANRLLNDLVASCQPIDMTVTLDYMVRGGIHTVVTANYERPHYD